MSEWGRINHHFHKHDKVIKAVEICRSSITLWTLANAYCRDHRTRGFLTWDEVKALGTAEEADALVRVELWDERDGGIVFHDYEDHNPPEKPRSTAFNLVSEVLSDHPQQVQQQMQVKVAELLEEGQSQAVLRAALKLWAGRPNAGPSLLAHMVSDVIRQGNDGLAEALRDAWRTYDVLPLARWGYTFDEPDIPLEIDTVQATRQYVKKAKRDWLLTIRNHLKI